MEDHTAAVEGFSADVDYAGSGEIPFHFQSPTDGWRTALIDLATGRVNREVPDAAFAIQSPGDGPLVEYRDFDADGAPTTVAGVDRESGTTLWTKPFEAGASISQLQSTDRQPGGFSSTGRGLPTGAFVLVTPRTLTVFDGLTGTVEMTADVSHCAVPAWFWGNGSPLVVLDEVRNSVVLIQGPKTCSVDRFTGAPTPLDDHGGTVVPLFGPSVTYEDPWSPNSPGVGTAYDRRDDRELWSAPVKANEHWLFAGGFLVRQIGNHIESIG